MIAGPPLEIRFGLRTKVRQASEGTDPVSTRRIGRLPRVTQVLALAIHLEDMIRRGEAKDYADLARLTCLCRERISQIIRLNYLASNIQVARQFQLHPIRGSQKPWSVHKTICSSYDCQPALADFI
jgi:hypothetical protein